ncbi:uncharacterized protein T_5 isoform X2 [Zeugodacus cucurbitae]|uniref:Transposable element P transposase n=1 Tax=Zeugodacus cucurbitae TaxID=28588 RepID=A0A0A1XJV0_ZEUCU|nr:uncharacterized protein T_5 isoform X2 [Zeugodacus cucurbitae]
MPGNSCAVCKSSWNNTVSMFSPPRDEYMRGKWEVACGVKLTQSSRLCSKHFTANDFTSANPKRARLQGDAVPSLNFTTASVKSRAADESLSAIDRKNRASMEQLLFFVNFARKHPKLLTSKFGAVSHLWEELACNLNSKDGACRSADKWKESMSTWRSQLRCRARRGKSSGVPQFDEFALWNFGQHALNEQEQIAITSTNNDLVDEDVGDENMVHNAKNIKDFLQTELGNIKMEVVNSDDDNSRHEDTQTNVAPNLAEVLDIKHDMDLSDDSNPVSKTTASNTVADMPTLDIPRTLCSKMVVIPRQIVTKESEKAKIFIIPRTTTENNTSTTADSVKRKIVTQPEPTSIANNSLSHIEDNTKSIDTPPQASNTSAISCSSKDLDKSESSQATSPPVVSHTASTPEPHVPERAANAAKKRKKATLHEMYGTLLDSMTRRDQREEQFITVMQGLTDAVTRMADNVKRLEEVLTFCAND